MDVEAGSKNFRWLELDLKILVLAPKPCFDQNVQLSLSASLRPRSRHCTSNHMTATWLSDIRQLNAKNISWTVGYKCASQTPWPDNTNVYVVVLEQAFIYITQTFVIRDTACLTITYLNENTQWLSALFVQLTHFIKVKYVIKWYKWKQRFYANIWLMWLNITWLNRLLSSHMNDFGLGLNRAVVCSLNKSIVKFRRWCSI